MIACLKGELFQKTTDKAIIDVGGVGYEVIISLASYDRLPAVGQEVFLHVHTSVREDAITLFGFWEHDEKEMFLLLTTVSGIGPKLGIGILSGIKPLELARAISAKDVNRLTEVSGVGKKTAARLCMELKDKVSSVVDDDFAGGDAGSGIHDKDDLVADVISALTNLGYPQVRAQQALAKARKRLPADLANMRVEDLLRETLRSLA